MGFGFDPGALLGRSFRLDGGVRVRLRLAHGGDVPAVQRLLERKGLPADELAVARLVRVDPRQRIVICACGLRDRAEELAGIGAIEIGGGREPSPVIVDPSAPPDLEDLLRRALIGRAEALLRARAS